MISKNYFLLIIIIVNLFITIQAQDTVFSGRYKPPDDLIMLKYRPTILLSNNDLKTIQKYINSSIENTDSKIPEWTDFFIDTLNIATESVQMPKEYLVLIHRFAILMKSHNHKLHISSISKLDNIIWWSYARNITNKQELMLFLDSQINLWEVNNILSLLIERGMFEQLELWSKKPKFIYNEFHKLKINAAIRQAKIVSLLKNDKSNLSQNVIDELKLSIDEILADLTNQKTVYISNHLRWYILHLSTFNQDKNITKILENLVNDGFYYNQDTIKKLSLGQINTSLNNFKKNIQKKAEKAVNPYEFLKQSGVVHY